MKLGDWGFLSSVGVVRLVGLASKDDNGRPAPPKPDEAPSFYALEGEQQTALIPIARAEELLRPLVTPVDAQELWSMLIAEAPETVWNDALVHRGQIVSGHGTPREHAAFLRELYGLPGPLNSEQLKGLTFFERLVLPELAHVLKRDLPGMVAELHMTHPSAESALALKILPS